MSRLLFLVLALALPLSACGGEVEEAPDGAPELSDPDADTPLDVDPLSRQDGQTSDEAVFDSARTVDDIGVTPVEDVDTQPAPLEPEDDDGL